MNKNGFNTFIPDMMPSFDDTLIAELQKELSDSRKICLITHKKPDGDALGSMLALGSVLSKLGHDVTMFSPDAYP
ncbi:MAG TPA: hypothetical protein PKM16_06505, partial [Bacteroidia bacterium]|nr:hypothetical protein [Bacteroidia bacterium]